MIQHSNRLVAIFSLVAAITCNGESPTIDPGNLRGASFMFQLDNDLFSGSDRDYTNGIRLAYLYSLPDSKIKGLSRYLRDKGHELADEVRRNQGEEESFRNVSTPEYKIGWGITQLMYTPSDPSLTVVPDGERPYAGWLGGELSIHSKTEDTLRSVLLTVGITGERTNAQEAQDWVHIHISESPLFQGWDRQTPEELTLNLHFDSKHRFREKEKRASGLGFDGYWEWGGSLGNFRTNAYLGSTLRWGLNLPVQYMTPRLQIGSYSHDLFVRSDIERTAFSLYGFASGRSTVVAHDITLDGPWFTEWEDSVGHTPLVFEGVLGLGLRWNWLTGTYSRTFRSNEFDGQVGGHQFGSVQAAASFYF